VTRARDVVLEESQFYHAPLSAFRQHEAVVGRVWSDAQPIESFRATADWEGSAIAFDDSWKFCFLCWGRCEDTRLSGWRSRGVRS
jgi:hypothetical protein